MSSAKRCSSTFHRCVRGLFPPPQSADRQPGRVREALFAEVLPPRADAREAELRGFRGLTDRHVPLVVGDVVDPVGDRLRDPGGKVVALDLDRDPGRLPLPPDGLVIADQLLLLTVDADGRLAISQRPGDRLVDMRKLRVKVGMLRTLTRLLVGLKPKPLALQKLPQRALGDLMPHPHQRLAQLPKTLRRPPQRRLGIPARDRIDQPIQIPDHPPIALNQRPSPATRPPCLTRAKSLAGLKLTQPPANGLLRKPGHPGHQRHPARPVRLGLACRPQPAPPLIALRPEQPPALSDLRPRDTIQDRRQPVRLRHENPFLHARANPFT